MVVDAGSISSWTPAMVSPAGIHPDDYPYSGWNTQWQGTAGGLAGYGGRSQTQASRLAQYPIPAGDTALVWTDQTTDDPGNITVMAFDAAALGVIAGDATLASVNGGLANLVAGRTYSVYTTAYCSGWVGANLARFRLVTTGLGAGTTYSAAITSSGPVSWQFSIPAGATGAYLAVEAMTSDPQSVVRFSKPVIHAQVAIDTASLGYLGGANAVPLRVAQIRMPAYYRKAGWPTPAKYLLRGGDLSFTPSTLPGTVGQPTVVDPRSVSTAADLRFLAAQNFVAAAGTWRPWKSSGVHAMTLSALNSDLVPYYASAVDNAAFNYQLSESQRVSIPSLNFDPGYGAWLYSDELDALGLTAYTVIAVLSLSNRFSGIGGIWSSAPVASGGGPDTDVDLTGVNYRAVSAVGPALRLDSEGMAPQSFNIGQAASVHKPTYLAMSFSNAANAIYYADTPASVVSNSAALASVSGPLTGSVVLGADATQALAQGSFSLFELNIYFSALTATQVQREIGLLGQVYG